MQTLNKKRSVPSGGTTGQVLAKASNTDHDTEWVNASGGGGSSSLACVQFENESTVNTTGTFATLNAWGEANVDVGSHGVSEVGGVFTFASAGTFLINASYWGTESANNRVEAGLQLRHNTGGGFSVIEQMFNYAARNNTQSRGGTQINGLLLTVSASDTLDFQVLDDGVVLAIAAGQARISFVKVA